MNFDFDKEEQIKYRDNLIDDYRKDYPENLEKLKENYILLKVENKGNEFFSASFTNTIALLAIIVAISTYSSKLLFVKLMVMGLGVFFLGYALYTRVKIQKNIIEMNVIEEIYPYIKK